MVIVVLYYDVILYKVGVFGGGTASSGPTLGIFHQHFSPKHGLGYIAVWFNGRRDDCIGMMRERGGSPHRDKQMM